MDTCVCGNLKQESDYICDNCHEILKSNNPSFMPIVPVEQVGRTSLTKE